jgi:glutaminyl-tRNA synthetase
VRLYDRLFTVPNPDDLEEGKSFRDYLNPYSKEVLTGAFVEPSVANDPQGMRYQFERLGYFVGDIADARPDRLVYNRIIELRDPWVAKRDVSTESTHSAPASTKPVVASSVSGTEPEGRRSKTDARDAVRASTPELAARLTRYSQELGLSYEDADLLSSDLALAHFFEDALAVYDNAKSVANWVTNEVLREAKESSITQLPFQGRQVGALAALVDGGDITPAMAKEVFVMMVRTGDDPMQIVRKHGLAPIRNAEQLLPYVEKVIATNQEKVSQYRSGRSGLLGFFVGQVMRETQNRADPKLVQELMLNLLKSE